MKKNLLLNVLSARGSWLVLVNIMLLVIVVALCPIRSAQAQVSLVKDINVGNANDPDAFKSLQLHEDGDLYFQYYEELWKSDGTTAGTVRVKGLDNMTNLVSSGDYVYFTAVLYEEGQEDTGTELWRSDGTTEGTIMVKDICPGAAYDKIHSLVNVNGTLFFVANNGVNGEELWKSDGTSAGTVLVKDILRVAGSSKPRDLTAMNGKLYFRANDGQKGFELWTSDGTDAGTVMVKDINPAAKASSTPEQLLNVNGTLYFFANDGTNGKQLWKSNGVIGNATMVKAINPGANAINWLAKLGNRVFFQANDGVHGGELWTSDGTDAGTFMVKDITPGPGSATMYGTPHIEFLNESNGKIYFQAMAVNYWDLWVSDGTTSGTYPITSENNPSFSWTKANITSYHGLTYFDGLNNESTFRELWKTDGTVAGTSRVYENIGQGYFSSPKPIVYKDKIYLFAKGELWLTDGTPSGIQDVKRFGTRAGSRPLSLTDVNGQLIFEAGNDSYPSTALWKTNGTSAGTEKVGPELRNITGITNVNGTVYFTGTDPQFREELWKSDGTTEGTMMVVDLTTDPNAPNQNSRPSNLIEYNGAIYFNAYTPYSRDPRFFTSDGTAEGTRMVSTKAEQLTKAGGKLFFTAQVYKGMELYVYDGVNPPVLTRDIKLHSPGSYPINLTVFNGILYFQADSGGSGYELWRSDGTTAGTYMVKNIRGEDAGSGGALAPIDMGNMMATSEALFFSALRNSGKNALWKSDGTENGTRPVVEFAGTPEAHMLAANGNTVTYILRYDSYIELWKSNGTTAGTTMIRSMPEMRNIDPLRVRTLNGVHYFVGYDFIRDQIWRTDGTAEGTYEIQFNGRPFELEVSGEKLYLSLDDPEYGWELFLINDEARSGMANARIATDPEVIAETEDDVMFTSYPNPFKSNLSLKVKGAENESFRINVMTINGAIIDRKDLKYNTEHSIGQTWQDGFYILQVYTGNKMFIRKVIKRS